MNKIIVTRHKVPCGELLIGSVGGSLCLCDWTDGWHVKQTARRLMKYNNADFIEGLSSVNAMAMKQLDEYFRGERRTFDIPLLLAGTDFQKRAWAELEAIPYGETISYSEQARRMGMPKAVRAVANANGANPVSIILPCHRVVGSDNSLTGYGGGLDVKRFLLELEKGV